MSKITGTSANQPATFSNNSADNNNLNQPQNTPSGQISPLSADKVQRTTTTAEHALPSNPADTALGQRQITLNSTEKVNSLKQSRQSSDEEQLVMLENQIQTLTTRSNREQCQRIETMLNFYMETLKIMDNPPHTTRQLGRLHGCLKEKLAIMPTVHKGFIRSSINTNHQFLKKLANEVNDKIAATMRAPHLVENLEIPTEIEEKIRIASNGCHEDDMTAMRACWDEKGLLLMPTQTRIDLTRNVIRIHDDNGICFDNSALRTEHGEKTAYEGEAAAREVLQTMEDQIIQNLDSLPVETQMQVISHINQTELNHMHNSLHATLEKTMPDWGVLSQTNAEQSIDVIRDKDSTRIIYSMNSRPSFLDSLDGEILQYDGQSRVSLRSTVTIDNNGNVDYGEIKAQINLHEAEEL